MLYFLPTTLYNNIWLYYHGEDYVPEMVTLETINVDPETKYPYYFNLKSTEIEKDPKNNRSRTRHVKVVTPDEFNNLIEDNNAEFSYAIFVKDNKVIGYAEVGENDGTIEVFKNHIRNAYIIIFNVK